MKYSIMIVVASIIIIVIASSCSKKPERPRPSSPSIKKPLLRQFGDLRLQDFEKYPVWVDCHVTDYDKPWYDETDEETYRPWDKRLPVDPTNSMFLIRATLTLKDGTDMQGFITPQNPNDSGGKSDLGLIHPQVFLPSGERFAFWYGMFAPELERISDLYSALGKSETEVFPISFKGVEGLSSGIISGTIPGLCYRPEDEIKIIK